MSKSKSPFSEFTIEHTCRPPLTGLPIHAPSARLALLASRPVLAQTHAGVALRPRQARKAVPARVADQAREAPLALLAPHRADVLVEVLQAHWWTGRTFRTPLTCRMAEQAHIRRVNKESNLKMAKQFVDTNQNSEK